MLASDTVKSAEWVMLFATLPRRARQPAGVLLLDPATDELHIRLRDDLDRIDDDFSEVWAVLGDDLGRIAREMGGNNFLLWLEDMASLTIQLSGRQLIPIVLAEKTADELFRLHVAGKFAERSSIA